jgi:hypothetical protein
MSGAHLDSDRLADAVRDASWHADESAHLAECAACRLELDVVAAARRLGAADMARLESGRVAQAVLDRLATAPPAPRIGGISRPARWLVGLAAAAALALAVWYGSSRGPSGTELIESPVELSVLHELDGLDEPELEEVLESMPAPAGAVSHLEPLSFDELNVTDLERVLRSMEE